MAYKSKVSSDEQRQDVEFVHQVRTAVQNWMDTAAPLQAAMLEDANFTEGGRKQWDQRDIKKREAGADPLPILSLNAIFPAVNFLSGYQVDREQDFRGFPRGSEDEQLSRYLSMQMAYAMDVADGQSELNTQFRQGIISGQCVLEIGHSFDLCDDILEGELTLTALPRNTHYRDIGGRRYDLNDCECQGKLFWLPQAKAQKRWPKQKDRLYAKHDWLQYDSTLTGVPEQLQKELCDPDKGQIRILQHWYRVPAEVALVIDKSQTDPAKAIVRRFTKHKDAEAFVKAMRDDARTLAADSLTIVAVNKQFGIVDKATAEPVAVFVKRGEAEKRLQEMAETYGQQAVARFEVLERETSTLRVAHLTGWQKLDDLPSPHGVDWRYPFSPFTAYQDSDDLTAIKGLVRDHKDAQRIINHAISTIQETLARGPKGQTWVPKGDNHDLKKLREQLSRAGFVGEFASAPPKYEPPGSFSPGDMALTEIAYDSIQRGTASAELMGQTTQKTVSGRAIGQRQAGGLVGFSWILMNWLRTKRYTGQLLVKGIQQHYSVEKMSRIVGQDQRIAKQMGLLGAVIPPQEVTLALLKQLKEVDFDVKVGFEPPSATARQAVANQLMTLKGIGAPIPMEFIVEASDVPFKEEIKSALEKQGEQPVNPELLRAVGGMQGSGPSPNGVNTSQ